MKHYIIEVIRDENEIIIEEKIIGILGQPYIPPRRGEFFQFSSDVEFIRTKVQPDGSGGYEVVEDTATTAQDLKDLMDSNIMAKATAISHGTTTESIQAFFQAFQIRVTNASEYISDGLVVRYAITGYALNDALDTIVKIEDYYNKILIEMDKYREAEIATYITDLGNL